MGFDRLWTFAEFHSIWKQLNPLTVYGKKLRNAKKFLNTRHEIECEFDMNEVLLRFMNSVSSDITDRVRFHLKNIPYIESFRVNGSPEIFQFKKFLYNLKALLELLDDEVKDTFGLCMRSEELLSTLYLGGGERETFTLSEHYSEKLKNIRSDIRELDIKIKNIRKQHIEYIKTEYDLDLRFRDFVIVPREKSERLIRSDNFYIEPYDKYSFVIRPVYPDEYLYLLTEKKELISTENQEEFRIIDIIRQDIIREKTNIIQYMEKIGRLDYVLARCMLIKRYDMKRPVVGGETIECEDAAYIPLQAECEKMNLPYRPLNIDLKKKINILRGSNMGGKTVVLKTIAFCQLLVQTGFYVRAERYSCPVFDSIRFTGEYADSGMSGLSSFGLEMWRLRELIEKQKGKVLVFIDEFARTTNSDEARALMSSLIEYFRDRTEYSALFSTHIMDLPVSGGVDFFRMNGLDIERFRKHTGNIDTSTLKDHIRLINSYMDYTVVRDKETRKITDAVNIAELLGVDRDIIEKAAEFFQEDE